MPQNIYDNDEFFAGYAQLERSKHGFAGAPEWPAVEALLPDLRGRAVLDLGCGYGWFCRKAVDKGAARALGLDLSARMLERAAALTPPEYAGRVVYRQADLDAPGFLDAPELSGPYDLAYSSLTLHYLVDLPRFLRAVRAALVPGGIFLCTAEHPMLTAPLHPGWQPDAEGKPSWPVNSYLVEGRREVDWIVQGVVKQHRSMGTCVNALVGGGFELLRLEEWGPTDAQLAADPRLAAERDRPTLVIFQARRRDA